MVIGEVLKETIQMEMSNITVRSNFRIAINYITWSYPTLRLVRNLAENIKNLPDQLYSVYPV